MTLVLAALALSSFACTEYREVQRMSASLARKARAALEEIVAAGRAKQRQEGWVVSKGLPQQGKGNLSYEEIQQLAGHHVERGSLPSGYSNARPSNVREPKRERQKSA